jgi:hypothetical protein
MMMLACLLAPAGAHAQTCDSGLPEWLTNPGSSVYDRIRQYQESTNKLTNCLQREAGPMQQAVDRANEEYRQQQLREKRLRDREQARQNAAFQAVWSRMTESQRTAYLKAQAREIESRVGPERSTASHDSRVAQEKRMREDRDFSQTRMDTWAVQQEALQALRAARR